MPELQDPREIELTGTTRSLLSQVTDSNESLEPYRPFSEEVGRRLRENLLPDRLVASLNMEGIAATRRQTLEVMDAMRVSENPDRGEQEIVNALQADQFIQDAVDRGEALTESLIREVHALLMKGLIDEEGQYRARQVELPGAAHSPPPPTSIPGLVQELTQLYRLGAERHAVVHAAWVHAQLALIHPFVDGNGRTARMLQDFTLLRRGFLPVGIPPSQRDDYYDSLEHADKGSWNRFVEMLADLEMKLIARAEAIATAPERRSAWVEELSEAAAATARQTRHKRYLVWRQRMERVTNAFCDATEELDAESDVIGAECRDFGVFDFSDWKRTCQYGFVPRNWLFSMLFYAEGKPFYKSVAFLRRHQARKWDPIELPHDTVALCFTGQDADDQERPNYENYSDPHIRLRKLLFYDDALFVWWQDQPGEPWECKEADELEGVVEQYFKDVFMRKAGLGAA